jgi:hypothetical protein
MKKISFFIGSLILLVISCNKESGKSGSTTPLQVSVMDVSEGMQVSSTTLSSNEVLDVLYTGSADSIAWWMTDSSHSIPVSVDSSAYYPYPPHDSVSYPHGDTIYTPPSIPVDSSHYPHDSTGLPPFIPPVDSVHYPGDTTIYLPPPYDSVSHPVDSTRKGIPAGNPFAAAYSFTTNKNQLALKINLSGHYTVNVAAYRKNADGSCTLIKRGYVKLSAN